MVASDVKQFTRTQNMQKLVILLVLFFSFSTFAIEKDRVADVVATAQENLLNYRVDGEHWNFPSQMGPHYVAQYAMFLDWYAAENETSDLSFNQSKMNFDKLAQLIQARQLPNGSWYQVADTNKKDGDMEPTIFNYMYLKSQGVSADDPAMLKAKRWILKKGGIEAAPLFTKIILAMFDNYPWKKVPLIPVTAFRVRPIVDIETRFGQWIYPHLLPISYLRKFHVHKNLGKNFDVSELFVKKTNIKNKHISPTRRRGADFLVSKIVNDQKQHGSWGGYTLASMLNLGVIDHFKNKKKLSSFPKLVADAFQYLDERYVEGNGISAYEGVTCDGRYWDTALSTISLLKSGYPASELQTAADFLIQSANSDGSYYFGLDFDQYPDTDDTAEIIITLLRLGRTSEAQAAVQWELQMQNSDGGWGAFARNNYPSRVLSFFIRDFLDSADLYDESSADVTGHVLEALGEAGYNIHNSEAVRKAVAYLRRTVQKNNAWIGRWGVNYLYGTGAALVGLLKVGVDPQDPLIQNALNFLKTAQNPDGGWGETTLSYDDIRLAGMGISTHTQTAWVLLALIEAGLRESSFVEKGVQYLVQELEDKAKWQDVSATGTGHPNVVYMVYPSYALTFPLMALGEYLNH
jgi:squalene-hopene/tetraprenyl-beta-curcumene cyclase